MTNSPKVGSVSDMLRATNHAGVTVCNRDRESGFPCSWTPVFKRPCPNRDDPTSTGSRVVLNPPKTNFENTFDLKINPTFLKHVSQMPIASEHSAEGNDQTDQAQLSQIFSDQLRDPSSDSTQPRMAVHRTRSTVSS